MPIEASSKVDIVTWLINVKHKWQDEREDHWANPSQYSFMREVLHESVHFWQAIGLPYFLQISFNAYKDFQRVRACAFQQGNKTVPLDLLQLEPNRAYFLDYQRLDHKYGELSGADIIEGLARYWDIHLCGLNHALERMEAEGVSRAEINDAQLRYGPFFLPDGLNYTDAALRCVFEHEQKYNKAYKFTITEAGEEAFILFPILGFLALSSGQESVSKFQRWIKLYASTKPFTIQRGNFHLAWEDCFEKAFRWITQELQEPIYSSLTVYNNLRKNMMGWGMTTPLPQRFGLIIGHGILDRYIQKYWQWMRAVHPSIPDEDVELRFHQAFCLPGNPIYRDQLLKEFHPPVILFADGKTWLDQENWGQKTPELEDELLSFGSMMGAAMALSGEVVPNSVKVKCPHTECPWYITKLCWKVARFPGRFEDCIMPNLYREQMNLDLPTISDWNVGQIERPIVKEHAHLLSIERN